MTDREREILAWISENPMISQQELAQRAGITRSSVAVHISNLMKKGAIRGKGYVLQTRPYITVVGGMNIDIFGCPHKPLVPRDSNPGDVRLSVGGVGRNIAHNLRLLGEDVKLITAFGEDVHAQELSKSCRELGIDITDSLSVPGGSSTTYLYITNHLGDMELAISDMELYSRLTPEFLSGRLDTINRAELCVADTNLPEESLAYLAQNCKRPLFVDTVSTAKAVKVLGILDKIHTLKPNRIEAELLTGIKIIDDHSLELAARKLISSGIRQVFLSLGGEGVYYADAHHSAKCACIPAKPVNFTGAGDSFMAALAWAYLRGMPIAEAARAGQAASSICIESEETISPHMSAEELVSRMEA